MGTSQQSDVAYASVDSSKLSSADRRDHRGAKQWTYLTNHGHIVLCLMEDPTMRLRDVASRVGITERAAQRIVSELEDSGVLTRAREGRRNRYSIHLGTGCRHPLEDPRRILELCHLMAR